MQVKAWARHQGINDATNATFNSFALTLMILLHLQCASPQVMPPLALLLPKDLLAGGAQHTQRAQRGQPAVAPQSLSALPEDAAERIGAASEEAAATCAALRRFGADNPAHAAELFAGFVVRFMVVSRAWRGASGAGVAACAYDGALVPTPFARDYAALVPDPFDSEDNTARSLGAAVDAPALRRVCGAFERTAKQLESLPDAAAVHAFVESAFGPGLAAALQEGRGGEGRGRGAGGSGQLKGRSVGKRGQNGSPGQRRRAPRQRRPKEVGSGGGDGAVASGEKQKAGGGGRGGGAAEPPQAPTNSVQACAMHRAGCARHAGRSRPVRGLHCRGLLRPLRVARGCGVRRGVACGAAIVVAQAGAAAMGVGCSRRSRPLRWSRLARAEAATRALCSAWGGAVIAVLACRRTLGSGWVGALCMSSMRAPLGCRRAVGAGRCERPRSIRRSMQIACVLWSTAGMPQGQLCRCGRGRPAIGGACAGVPAASMPKDVFISRQRPGWTSSRARGLGAEGGGYMAHKCVVRCASPRGSGGRANRVRGARVAHAF